MRKYIERQAARRRSVARENVLRFCQDAVDRWLGQNDAHHGQPALNLRLHELVRGGKPCCSLMSRDIDRSGFCTAEESSEHLSVPEREGRPKRVASRVASDAVEQGHKSSECGGTL